MIALRFRGPADELSAEDRRALLNRSTSIDAAIPFEVAAIIDDVRARGDVALRDLAARFDPAIPAAFEVPRCETRRALDNLDPALRRAMQRSADNIATVHRASLPSRLIVRPEPGITVIRRPDPLARVGIYAPGGRAAYPSSVLMGAVPARVAGVGEVILCSPPSDTGLPPATVLGAAELAGVDRVFGIGGAGAIAAMAIGTASVPRVDRIIGPGNAYVAEAKLQLVGAVAIDAPAGPSELLVIVDETADPQVIALEMAAQAEHDPLACVVAVCVGDAVAARLEAALARVIAGQPRVAIIESALRRQGGVITVRTDRDAIELANAYAPEHLMIACADAPIVAEQSRAAGTVFIGETSSVAFGDYISGANHVLPTGGLARSYSGLSVLDFFRWTTCQAIDSGAAGFLAADTSAFALAEGLPGHAAAAGRWRTS